MMDVDEEIVSVEAIEQYASAQDEADAAMEVDEEDLLPKFNPVSAAELNGVNGQYIRIAVPPHRITPLRNQWMDIYTPIVEHMKLQIRYNQKRRCVELRSTEYTELGNALTKCADFIRAFLLGFELRDAIALLRLDDLFIDSFEIRDVKTLQGEHLARAIGRIAGIGGKTKHTIENATKTRIVLADQKIHILGSFSNIRIAKTAIVRLIMGSPPGKVYNQMRAVASRLKERF